MTVLFRQPRSRAAGCSVWRYIAIVTIYQLWTCAEYWRIRAGQSCWWSWGFGVYK